MVGYHATLLSALTSSWILIAIFVVGAVSVIAAIIRLIIIRGARASRPNLANGCISGAFLAGYPDDDCECFFATRNGGGGVDS